MTLFSSKTGGVLKQVAIFSILFLAVFLGTYYIVNLDLGPKNASTVQQVTSTPVDISAELKKRLGSTDISMESYRDWGNKYGLTAKNDGLDADAESDGLPNYLEYVHGTNPLKADSDGDGFTDKQEIANGYDPDAPGETKPVVDISIQKINISAPMVWSKSDIEKEVLADLQNGVAHFSKTASPGQNGNMIISGHSSNYIWNKGNYNHIFKDLNNLEKGDSIKIRTIQQNGRIIKYNYTVSDKFITAPDDQRVFENSEKPTLTLSTCWPIGTTLKRVIIKAVTAV